ncbi:MAG: hypothetical protein IJY66_02030 [Clostridia bacterium]|nr:hypothetical protein [Clostridia bacterium]
MKRIVLALLALLLCASMVLAVGCTDTEQPDEPQPDEQPDEQPVEDDGISFALADGSSRYVVMRSDLEPGGHPVTKAAVALRDALKTKIGNEVTIATDWEKNPDPEEIATRYEILVGKTNRPESKAALESLEQYSWTIRVSGKKIVLVGGNDNATVMAVQAFINTYINGDGVISESLNVTESYTPMPTEIFPEDKSNGKTYPAIVETVYPTEDVVIADVDVVKHGYAVDPTGMSDSTAGIQKALNDVSNAGGGTVWLPKGVYVISGQISIPAFVTLRGDWQDPDVGNEYGTVISVWNESKDSYASEKEVSEGIFMLGGSGGVVGLTVYYPHQSLTGVKPYPFTFYTNGSGANYMLSTVKNVTVINGYRGIGACCTPAGAHEQLTVENFKGTFLYCGTEVYNQADVGTWQDVTISPKYWQNALDSMTINALTQAAVPTADDIATYVKANAVGLKLGDLEWTEFESLKVDGCKIGIEIVQGKRIQFAGSLYDTEIRNCTQGLVVHDLDPRWGMVIARSTIENGIYNTTGGMVKLCGVTTTGALEGEISTTNNDDDLSDFSVNYKASYKKPAANFSRCELPNDKDVSADIQAALDAMAAQGGVVYIPAGHYRLDNPLTVPAGVELRGSSSVATRDQGGRSAGTVFECFYGDDDDNGVGDQAFITLNGDYAGLNGIRIIYPENSNLNENLNTTYTVRGKGKGVYMVNCAISASAYGVDFHGCDEHFIKKVTTCCYYNTFLLGGKGGILSGCLQNGTVIYRTSGNGLQNWPSNEANIWAELFDPITRLYNDYIIVENATDQLIYNTFVYGCAKMITNRNSEGTLVVNIGCDNIGNPDGRQLLMESGSMVAINTMRYNGKSFTYVDGDIDIYNRITIGDKGEKTYIK